MTIARRSPTALTIAIIVALTILPAMLGRSPDRTFARPAAQTTPASSDGQALLVYLYRGSRLGVASRTVRLDGGTKYDAAVQESLRGALPSELAAGLSTRIPNGIELLDPVSVDTSSGVATVNLSSRFNSDSATTLARRMAQVVFVLTQFPEISGVEFQIEGTAVNAVDPTGAPLPGSASRDRYEALLPAIFLERPTPWDVVQSRIVLSGTASVPGETFEAALRDTANRLIANTSVSVAAGDRTRGGFEAALPFTVGAFTVGTLELYRTSASGAVADAVAIPIQMLPTPTPTSTSTATATRTATASMTPTRTFAPTRTPTRTPSPTATATSAPTRIPTRTPTATATRTPTATATSVAARIPTNTPTATATAAPTRTPTIVPTATNTPRPTRTPTPTQTPTPRPPTVTPSPTQTPTATATKAPTIAPVTRTPTRTATVTPTATDTVTPTETFTETPLPTQPPTETATATETPTEIATITETPTPTATETATVPAATLTPTSTEVASPAASPVEVNQLLGAWELYRIDAPPGTVVQPTDPERYTVTFARNGTVVVVSDCKRARGTFTVGRESMTIDLRQFSNRNATCPDGELPDNFLTALGEVTSYRIEGDTLTLELPDDGGTVELVAPGTTPTPTPPDSATPTES